MYCIWLLASSLIAQSTLPDRVTFTDGKSTAVNLRRTAPAEQALTVTFTDPAGELRQLSPTDVREFHFSRSDRTYRSVAVDLPRPGATRAPRTQLRFAEVLARGDIELLRVALDGTEYEQEAAGSEPYLYILRDGDAELILKLTSIVVYDQLHANPARFRNLLKFLARDCPAARELARTAGFTDRDILGVLSAYADCDHRRTVVIDQDRLQGGFRLDHYGQLLHVDIRDADFSHRQLSIGAGYTAMARFTERFERLAVLASLQFMYHSFRWEMSTDAAQSMLRGNFSLGYSVVHRDSWQLQLTGGLSNYNALSSSFRSFFSNNYFLLSAGANLHGKNLVFGLHYEHLPGQIPRRPGNQLVTSLGYRVRF
ncbi:hypothetical protein [Lewinella sp. JB7]|uniref:hypothetical protein n=1 Tax=Lewinella sp. JB7 TaxID=2962887 RepID=UPI0020C93ECA|nr:hypothetical protein [Lewinella sp. JB7]MCP9237281.1 hypothetical protein [Lewinella sp. JB7]